MDPGTAEAMALFHGVSLCISLGFQNVFLEGDAKTKGEEKREEERDGKEEENGFPERSLGCKNKNKKGRERWGRKYGEENVRLRERWGKKMTR